MTTALTLNIKTGLLTRNILVCGVEIDKANADVIQEAQLRAVHELSLDMASRLLDGRRYIVQALDTEERTSDTGVTVSAAALVMCDDPMQCEVGDVTPYERLRDTGHEPVRLTRLPPPAINTDTAVTVEERQFVKRVVADPDGTRHRMWERFR